MTHPGCGCVMDPLLNLNKPKQPDSPDDDYPLEPVTLPRILGKLPPVPTPLMEAIRVRCPGGPEVLEYRSVTTPTPKPGEVLIRITAASVNKYDTIMRKGACSAAPGDII